MEVKIDTNLDEKIEKTKQLLEYLKEIDNQVAKLQFVSIQDVVDATGWSKPTVEKLFNRKDFPSSDFGKEKQAEIHAVIKYFSEPRRK